MRKTTKTMPKPASKNKIPFFNTTNKIKEAYRDLFYLTDPRLLKIASNMERLSRGPENQLSLPRPKWSVPTVPCSVHCRYTAAYAVYLQYRLLIHCWHTADCSVHCAYTACMVSYGSILYTAHTLPASGSVPAVYVQPTLPVHSTSVWVA